MLTFALNGKLMLPEPVARKWSFTPIEMNASPEKIEKGSVLFAQWCAVCHGLGAAGGGATADLRYSNAVTFDKYRDIILEGKYQGMGMPWLKSWLTEDDVDAIRAYVLKRRATLAEKK